MLKKKPGGVTGRFLGLVAQWGTAGGEGVEVSAPTNLCGTRGFPSQCLQAGSLAQGLVRCLHLMVWDSLHLGKVL